MELTLFGIKNCDTMKKAMKWLDDNGIVYHFHDYKKEGVPEQRLRQWLEALGWETVINKRGTTWRGLSDDVKNTISEATAIPLMAEHPATIKRPVFVKPDGSVTVGFTKAVQDGLKG